MKTTLIVVSSVFVMVMTANAIAEDLHHDDYQSGEAGAKLGTAVFNSTIGKDKPIPNTPSFEEQIRQKARDAGHDAGTRSQGRSSDNSSQNSPYGSSSERRTDNPRRP
jgi:hypothetical protein